MIQKLKRSSSHMMLSSMNHSSLAYQNHPLKITSHLMSIHYGQTRKKRQMKMMTQTPQVPLPPPGPPAGPPSHPLPLPPLDAPDSDGFSSDWEEGKNLTGKPQTTHTSLV